MLNWIALYLSNFLVRMFALEPNQQRSYMIHDSAKVNLDLLSHMFGDARLALFLPQDCSVPSRMVHRE